MRHRSYRIESGPLATMSRRFRTSPLMVPGAMLTATALAAVTVVVMTSSAASTVNLVQNPGFEQNLTGWNQSLPAQQLTRVAGGHSGGWAAQLTRTSTGTAALNDNPNTVLSTTVGTSYDVSAWVRALKPSLSAGLRIREVKSGKLVNQAVQSISLADTAWHQVSLHYTTQSSGGSLDLNVLAWKLGAGNALLIDDVALMGPAPDAAPAVVSPPAQPTPTPTVVTPSPTPVVTTPPPVTPSTPPPSTPPSTPSSPSVTLSNSTMFGWAVPSNTGVPFATAFQSTINTFGSPQVVRVYNPGLPGSWTGAAGLVNRPVVVSFKALPLTILSGADDAALQSWFDSAPTNQPIWWSYYHEPEDNIAKGEFTASDYRAAWAHIATLADQSNHPNLHATLILMCWTLNPASGRNFADYYPGPSVIDTLGWDCYNAGYPKGVYDPPASIFGRAVNLSHQLGKPFGIAEWGSQMAVGDDGTARGAWITSVAAYLRAEGASWATYFDSNTGGTFVLTDAPSILALSATL